MPAVLALAGFLYNIEGLCPRRALLRGWLFGALAWASGIYWLPRALHAGLGGPELQFWVVYAGVCVYSGLAYGLLAAIASAGREQLVRRLSLSVPAASALAFVPALTAVEGYYPLMYKAKLSDSVIPRLPALQSLELFGPAGLALLIAGLAAALHYGLRTGRWRPLLAGLALAAANEAYGSWRIGEVDAATAERRARGGAVRVAVLQAAIPVKRRYAGYADQTTGAYNELTKRALAEGPLDLVVWPQGGYEKTLDFPAGGEMLSASVEGSPAPEVFRRELADGPELLLSGIGASSEGRYATAFLVGRDRALRGVTTKRDLMPLAESIPVVDEIPSVRRLLPPWLPLSIAGPRRVLSSSSATLGVFVCSEGIVPGPARQLARAGAEILINVSSDGDWYGSGVQPEQNLGVARLRAIENRRYLIRAGNSGISALIDPVGRVERRLEFREPGYFRAEIPRLESLAPQSWLGPALYRLAALAAALMIAAALASRLRPAPPP